jgi:predicted HTH domain antitoxin
MAKEVKVERIVVEIPDALVEEFELHDDELREVLLFGLHQREKIRRALELYQQGQASIAKAAQIAGLSLHEMMEQAAKHGIEPHVDEQMIRKELSL